MDKELASRAGIKSGQVRRAKKLRRQQDPLSVVKESLGDSLEALVAASQGKGTWKDLPVSARLQALMKVIEYGVGKTVTMDKVVSGNQNPEGGGTEAPGTIEFT